MPTSGLELKVSQKGNAHLSEPVVVVVVVVLWLWLWLWLCVGCDIVQADHAPEAGVAQGIFHGILVRHQGRHQEEVEEGLEEEDRETGGERTLKQPNTSAHAWMTWNDTQGET